MIPAPGLIALGILGILMVVVTVMLMKHKQSQGGPANAPRAPRTPRAPVTEPAEASSSPAAMPAAPGAVGREASLRRDLALERRRARRAQRRERHAQRLLVMARCLVGARANEVATRAARAVLDDFAAESASVWVFDPDGPRRLAEAVRTYATPPELVWDAESAGSLPSSPSDAGSVHIVSLRGEHRDAIGFLVAGFGPAVRQRPPGLEAYAAFVGQLLASELERLERSELPRTSEIPRHAMLAAG